VVVRSLTQAALAGIAAEAERFDRSAAEVTAAAAAPSLGDAATVRISAEARSSAAGTSLTSGIEGAMADMRIAKYGFIANLKVLQTAAEVDETAANLIK
jgi:hypothetical protein